jgi:hypothetical protein
MEPSSYDTSRYLAAKRSVDDRALHRGVLEAFRDQLGAFAHRPLRVLELGAGLGNMVRRLWDFALIRDAHYTLLDRDGECLREAAARISGWGAGLGELNRDGARLRLRAGAGEIEVTFADAELFGWLRDCPPGTFDVVLAHAVLDLVDVPSLLPLLWRALTPGALGWLTINFDGETILLPELPLDREIMHLYHRSMDVRVIDGRAAGHSKTGRRLLEQLPASGATVIDAGCSDWVVRPSDRRYPEDESYFLHHIVHTIDAELRAHKELDAGRFGAWVKARHVQIEAGELVYIAHQLDVLARAPGSAGAADAHGENLR